MQNIVVCWKHCPKSNAGASRYSSPEKSIPVKQIAMCLRSCSDGRSNCRSYIFSGRKPQSFKFVIFVFFRGRERFFRGLFVLFRARTWLFTNGFSAVCKSNMGSWPICRAGNVIAIYRMPWGNPRQYLPPWPLRFLLLLKPMAKKNMHDSFWNVFRAGVCSFYFAIQFFCFFCKKELCMSRASIPKERKLASLRIHAFGFFGSQARRGTSYVNIFPVNASNLLDCMVHASRYRYTHASSSATRCSRGLVTKLSVASCLVAHASDHLLGGLYLMFSWSLLGIFIHPSQVFCWTHPWWHHSLVRYLTVGFVYGPWKSRLLKLRHAEKSIYNKITHTHTQSSNSCAFFLRYTPGPCIEKTCRCWGTRW